MSRKSFLILVIFFPLLTLSVTSLPVRAAEQRPAWLDLEYNPQDVYYGISWHRFDGSEPSFEVQKEAELRALDNLCLKLSVTVVSEMRDIMSHQSENGRIITEEDVSSYLFVTTRQTLKGWKVKDTWTALDKKIFWVLVVIDKEEADRQVREQRFINEVVDGLKDEIQSVLKQQKKLAEKLNAQMEERMREFLEKIRENEKKRVRGVRENELPEPDPAGSTGLPEPVRVQ